MGNIIWLFPLYKEGFIDTKGVIRVRKSTDRQHNDQRNMQAYMQLINKDLWLYYAHFKYQKLQNKNTNLKI